MIPPMKNQEYGTGRPFVYGKPPNGSRHPLIRKAGMGHVPNREPANAKRSTAIVEWPTPGVVVRTLEIAPKTD